MVLGVKIAAAQDLPSAVPPTLPGISAIRLPGLSAQALLVVHALGRTAPRVDRLPLHPDTSPTRPLWASIDKDFEVYAPPSGR
jgi:hypothetical protein